MLQIDFLNFSDRLRLRKNLGKTEVFDPVRKKYVRLSPEESVRQLVIHYLNEVMGYKKSLMSIEKMLIFNDLVKRYDLLVFDARQNPFLLVECKAPSQAISQETFRQIAWYNMSFKVPFLMVTNGLQTWCCQMDYEKNSWKFLNEIPPFSFKEERE